MIYPCSDEKTANRGDKSSDRERVCLLSLPSRNLKPVADSLLLFRTGPEKICDVFGARKELVPTPFDLIGIVISFIMLFWPSRFLDVESQLVARPMVKDGAWRGNDRTLTARPVS